MKQERCTLFDYWNVNGSDEQFQICILLLCTVCWNTFFVCQCSLLSILYKPFRSLICIQYFTLVILSQFRCMIFIDISYSLAMLVFGIMQKLMLFLDKLCSAITL